jgi:hypothetical protein
MLSSKKLWALSVSDSATDDMCGDIKKCHGIREIRFSYIIMITVQNDYGIILLRSIGCYIQIKSLILLN